MLNPDGIPTEVTPLGRAEQAVTEAAADLMPYLCRSLTTEGANRMVDDLIAAVRRREEARLRTLADGEHLADRDRTLGHHFADVLAGWPSAGSRARFGPGEGLEPEKAPT